MKRIKEYQKSSGFVWPRRNAEATLRKHAKRLAKVGWEPTEVRWSPYRPGCSAFWLTSPGGVLTVTYERPDAPRSDHGNRRP
jgi:hypothetical protein